ncbi:MAG TPA: transglutaminase domain-containing protein [Clostridiales bacterium]|jgi:transglutaminase-like putative cysteine protease|nr:transglutaminase domain-containing protein [Clostridiales bacterium]
MGQGMKDGIYVDNAFFVVEENKSEFPLYMRLIQWIAIFLSGWCFASVFIESFLIPVNHIQVNMALLLSSVVFFLIFLFQSYDFVKGFFVFLFYGLFLYSRLERIKNGFYILENLVISRAEDYYGFQSIRYLADYTTETQDTTLLVIMIIIPVIALLSYSLLRNNISNLSIIILFLPVAASFLVGLIPAEHYLVIYITATLYLVKASSINHKISDRQQRKIHQRVSARSAIVLSVFCIVLFFLMNLFVSRKEYESIIKIKEIKVDLQKKLFDLSLDDITNKINDLKFSFKVKASGGLSGGRLGRVGEVEFDNSEHLRIILPSFLGEQGLYVKGYVGTNYTGDRWDGHTAGDKKKYQALLEKIPSEEFDPMNMSVSLIEKITKPYSNQTFYDYYTLSLIQSFIYKAKLKIEYVDANKKYLYVPYLSDYNQIAEKKYVQDLYVTARDGKESYELDFYNYMSIGKIINNDEREVITDNLKLGTYTKYEKIYRDFVYDVYTKMPEKKLERLKKDFSNLKITASDHDLMKRINYVKSYLERHTDYSLSPGKLPRGKDFIEYFLYENKRGYCAHYASAATMIFRAMGIPARYVEGYAVGSFIPNDYLGTQMVTFYTGHENYRLESSQAMISVKDYNAHAWVEVYVDGCGWVPVEVTPGSGVVGNEETLEYILGLGENIDDLTKEQVTPIITPDPTASPTPKEGIKESVIDKEDEQPGSKELKDPEFRSEKKASDTIILWLFTFLFLLTLAILSLIRFRKNNAFASLSQKALRIYKDTEKILTLSKEIPGQKSLLEDHLDYVRKHCTYIKEESFSDFMETIWKARFSKAGINQRELQHVEEVYRSLYQQVYKDLNPIKRLYLKLKLNM